MSTQRTNMRATTSVSANRSPSARRSFRARAAPLRDSSDQVIGTICVAVSDEEGLREQEYSAGLMSTA